MSAGAREYVVQPGDTLALIALKFDVSTDWLKRLNHLSWSDMIFPGDVLLIGSETEHNTFVEPISVTLFDVINQDVSETPGKLLIIGDTLRFEAPDKKPIVINLTDVVESAILVHPFIAASSALDDPDTPFLLSLSVACEVDGKQTTRFWYFSGKNSVVRAFEDRLVECMDAANTALMKREQAILAASLDDPPPEPIPVQAPVEEQKKSDVAPTMVRSRVTKKLPDAQMIGSSVLLKHDEVDALRLHLPHRYRTGNWKLLFCLSKDGCSYRTFFSRTEKKHPVVMVLLTDGNERIGCFVSCGFMFSRHYYGSGETFVFRLQPSVEIFKWAQGNEFFTCSTENEIAIGGGGASAIWIGGNLLNAFSESCPTFDSPSLTKEMRFKIVDLEVWQIEG